MPDAKYGRLFAEEDMRLALAHAIESAWESDDAVTVGDITARVLGELPTTFPPDEPLFLLRASERESVAALHGSLADMISRPVKCALEGELTQAAAAFREWQAANPDRVKAPD